MFEALSRLRESIDELLSYDRTALSGHELIQCVREFETQLHRLAAVDVANLAEVETRHLAAEARARDTAGLLVQLVHVDAGEARQRVNLARDLAPKTLLSGETVPSVFAATAGAVAAGEVARGHAQRIASFFDRIEYSAVVEEQLLHVAVQTSPVNFGKFAAQLAERLDPEGPEPDPRKAAQRAFTLATGSDGWSLASGRFSPELTATVKALLDSLSAPKPAEDGTPDERTATQRRHDALLDAGKRLLSSGTLPDAGGAPLTILVTVDEASLRERVGYGVTGHGDLLPIADVLRLAADAELIPVVLSDSSGVVAYGRSRRLASCGQRRALAARDGGCSFPGCSAPPGWTEVHHVTSWLEGGPSDLDNMTLLCGHHHRTFASQGWECQIVDRVPHWRPPNWLDPDQQPVRNRAHHTEPVFAARC